MNTGVGKLPLPPTPTQRARAELRRDFETYLSRQRGLSEEIVLKAVRSGGTTARRDYAMALLQARWDCEHRKWLPSKLDDIDWRAGEIIVRGKGERRDRLPLPPDVGKALADYIKIDWVTTSRVLFVTQTSPHRPFKNGGVLNLILREAFARTGLKPPVPYAGSHVLRHSLAVNLARNGTSLEEIADTLRHRRRSTTMLYARLDIDGLRSVAHPWPVAGGAQ